MKQIKHVLHSSSGEHVILCVGLGTDVPEPIDPQICQAVCAIMKLSFEEDYRHALKELGQ